MFHPGDKAAGFPTVGYVGRLEKFKGIDVLVRAAVLAETAVRILIVGDGCLD